MNFDSIPMGNYHDHIYYAKIGYPGAKSPLKVLLDTGSNESWLISDQCDSYYCDGRNYYSVDPVAVDADFVRVRYYSGSIEGFGVSDSIYLGSLRADDQHFIAASYVNIENIWNFEGIIGMGPKSKSVVFGKPTFVENLYRQDQISNAIFTFIFNAKSLKLKNELIIGGIDRRKYLGHLTWIQNNSPSFWQVPILRFGVGHHSYPSSDYMIFDSGTPYIVCPHDTLMAINDIIGAEAVDDSPYYAVPCKNSLMRAKLTFEVGGRKESMESYRIELYPEDYIYEEDDICYTAFISHPEWADHPQFRYRWVMGAHFMKIYYLAFDMETDQIGIAPLKIPRIKTYTDNLS